MNAPAPRLLIGTPAYGGMMHSDYVSALLQYQRVGIDFALMTIGNESLITRARNTILSEFDARGEFSHLLFLDADVLLPPAGLRRLLQADRDVIGAAKVVDYTQHPDVLQRFADRFGVAAARAFSGLLGVEMR